MPASVNFPEDWDAILDLIRSGDDQTAKRLLIDRERSFDAYFTTIDRSNYLPILMQGSGTFTYDPAAATTTITGYRIGPWVMINVHAITTNSPGTSGPVQISLPLQFPVRNTVDYTPCGQFWLKDTGPPVIYSGTAVIISGAVQGMADVSTGGAMGSLSPTKTFDSGDRIAMSVQYQTLASTS